jgi:hypothetical protein
MGMWIIAPLIFNLGIDAAVSFMPRPLYSSGKNHRYPLKRDLCESQSWSGRFKEEKNLLPPSGIELRFLGRETRSLLLIPTTLSQLIIYSRLVHN